MEPTCLQINWKEISVLITFPLASIALALYWWLSRKKFLLFLSVVLLFEATLFYNPIPAFSIAGKSAHALDILLIVSLLIAYKKYFFSTMHSSKLSTASAKYLFLFFIVIHINLILSIFINSPQISIVIQNEYRPILYYSFALLVPLIFDIEYSYTDLIRVFYIIGFVMLSILFIQVYLFKEYYFVRGRIDPIYLYPELQFFGLQRIITPADALFYFLLFYVLTKIFFSKPNLFDAILLIPLLVTQLISYNRSSWIALFISIIIMFVISKSNIKIFSVRNIVVLTSIVLYLFIFQYNFLEQVVLERFRTVFRDEGLEEGTLAWRVMELSFAVPRFLESPFIGIGLGASYRPPMIIQSFDLEGVGPTMIHNGYMHILLKTGLIGFIPFALYRIKFWLLVKKHINNFEDNDSAVFIRAAFMFSVAVAIQSFVNFRYLEPSWVIIESVVIGTVLKLYGNINK